MHVRKNDRVIVVTGKDKGKVGKVLRVIPETSPVVVQGNNKGKRHTKPNQQNRQGGIVEKQAPLHSSNVMLVTKDGKPTRVGYKTNDGGTKVRIARKTGEEI